MSIAPLGWSRSDHRRGTDHAGNIRSGRTLWAPGTATTVRLDSAEPVLTDGPLVEGKEVVSGYAEIEVADLDEALRMVQAWPVARSSRSAPWSHDPWD